MGHQKTCRPPIKVCVWETLQFLLVQYNGYNDCMCVCVYLRKPSDVSVSCPLCIWAKSKPKYLLSSGSLHAFVRLFAPWLQVIFCDCVRAGREKDRDGKYLASRKESQRIGKAKVVLKIKMLKAPIAMTTIEIAEWGRDTTQLPLR